MSLYRTELFIDENPNKINHKSKLLSLGSGFSHLIDERFDTYKLDINSNPFGTVYNPISIFNNINIISKNEAPNESFYTETDGNWNHFDFHQKSNLKSKEELKDYLSNTIQKTNEWYKKTDFLILTFGTAYTYKLLPSNHVVANCHKASPKKFEKVLLTPEEIVEGFRRVYQQMNNITDIVLVVSPVMHTRDSITLNAVSKSVLRLACHLIKNEFPHVKYFPAYEFLNSDLREYRYYQRDLIHPTETAIDYLFQKFAEAYFEEEDKKVILAIEKILEKIYLLPYNPQGYKPTGMINDAIKEIKSFNTNINLSKVLDKLNSMI